MRKLVFGVISVSLAAVMGVAPVAGAQAKPADSGIVISQAWIRSSEYSDHVGGMTGIFAKITNRSNRTVVLTGGSTELASMVQTHQVVEGVMSQKAGGIKIAKGATVTLQPGGLHIMLMNLTRPLLAGDSVKFTFSFAGAKPQTLTLLAKPVVAGGEAYHPTATPMPMPSSTK